MAKKKQKRRSNNKGITLIKKSNQLIEARYKFDVWETRIFLSVLSCIRRNDEDFQSYRIWYKDVIKAFGLRSGQSYALLRDAARSLMGKTFKVNNKSEGFNRVTEYHIIRTVDYLKEGQDGKKGVENQEFLDITVEPEMRPMLLQLQKNFTAYDLQNVVKLGSYPIRVYELLKQYERIGHRKLYIEEMKRMFELSEEYPLFANFYQKVIKPSIRDINAHTDLTITNVEKVKEGRRVVALKFYFSSVNVESPEGFEGQLRLDKPELPTPNASISLVQEETEKDRLFKKYQEDVVTKFGVTPSVFLALLDKYGEEDLEKALRVTRRAKANAQIKSNVAGFFVQALKDGFTDAKEEALSKKEQAQKMAELQSQLDQLAEDLNAAINDKIRQIVAEKPDTAERAIEALRENPMDMMKLDQKERFYKRPLTMEDFRQDAELRSLLKHQIVEMEKRRFSYLYGKYNKERKVLKEQLRAIG